MPGTYACAMSSTTARRDQPSPAAGPAPPGTRGARTVEPPLVAIEHLALAVGTTPILHDVNLHLRAGEIYGLLGPNGAGKTTTLAAILGLLPTQAGSIRVLGVPPHDAPAALRRRLGVLPEQNGVYDWMTAPSYLAFFAGLHGADAGAAAIAERLAAVGLAPRRGQTLATFSRGMRQRLGLARALIGEPSLLVLDEPTNGLDPRGRRDIHDLLLRLAGEQGVGILLCTHLLDDVERLCDRIGILVAGRTAVEGPLAELRAGAERGGRYRVRTREGWPAAALPPPLEAVANEGDWHLVELNGDATPEEAWRALFVAGWPIVEIRREGNGLEQLYLRLTQGASA